MNPALSRAVNRAIATGAPVLVEQKPTPECNPYQIRIRQCAAMFLVEHMRHGSWHIIESLDHGWQVDDAAKQYRDDGATVTEC